MRQSYQNVASAEHAKPLKLRHVQCVTPGRARPARPGSPPSLAGDQAKAGDSNKQTRDPEALPCLLCAATPNAAGGLGGAPAADSGALLGPPAMLPPPRGGTKSKRPGMAPRSCCAVPCNAHRLRPTRRGRSVTKLPPQKQRKLVRATTASPRHIGQTCRYSPRHSSALEGGCKTGSRQVGFVLFL